MLRYYVILVRMFEIKVCNVNMKVYSCCISDYFNKTAINDLNLLAYVHFIVEVLNLKRLSKDFIGYVT